MTRSAAPKVPARKAREANPKTTSKGTIKARDKHHKTAPKVAEKVRKKVAAERVRDTHRKTEAQLQQFRGTQGPDTLRVLAERNVSQSREVYERSKSTLQAVLESWQKSFGAAGQDALALNRRMIAIAERNIHTSFDFATSITRARNLGDVMELQAAYWRKLLSSLQTQTQEPRTMSPQTREPKRNQ